MNDSGGNYVEETSEMVTEGVANASPELRKRRSTRIVQAVPLGVTGVDALGRPFVERTSSLIVNCHGCRYQSKHYVLKNMWVTLEIPHPETGQPPRSVRGRVAWIQRPRTVRQLFQVALELEVAGNVWGIGFPPEDWFAFPETPQGLANIEVSPETPQLEAVSLETEVVASLAQGELPIPGESDNVTVFPSPANATDASLQLARHVARLVTDAKQQIQAATKEAASQAVSAERRLSFEQWEQKFAAGRAEIEDEASRAIEKFQRESDEISRRMHAAAAEALHSELPRWLAPQLEQLIRELTSKLSKEGAAQRNEHAQQLESIADSLRKACQQGEYITGRLKTQAEQVQTQIGERAEAALRALDEAANQREVTAEAQGRALKAIADEIQRQVTEAIATAQSSWQGQLAAELESAQARWRAALESTLAEAQDRAAGGLNQHAGTLMNDLQEELARHATSVKDAAMGATAESEKRITALLDGLQERSQHLEETLTRANEINERLESRSQELTNKQQQALAEFQNQVETTLLPHRDELQRRSEAIFEEINARIQATFEQASRQAVAQFDRQVQELVQPHISRTEEAIHRMAGGRSLLDAALTLQQDRIRNSADEAFADSLARFRENLGTVEQVLQESSQAITGRQLEELEAKVSDLKHQVVEELFKSAEWYEKKALTQIQNLSERAVENVGNQLREKAGEISGAFAGELDHSSRSFVGHAQTQMEEVVRDSFERARALFAEAADTTAAAFTDEIQRTGRNALDGFGEELRHSIEGTRGEMNVARKEMEEGVTSEQQNFLRRFQTAMSGAIEAGVAEAQQKVQEGFAPLLAAWKSMTDAHQKEMQRIYDQIGEQAAEQHKNRLENVSNQWMLATVASLDHQSREMISRTMDIAEEKLRESCAQVFAGIGESFRERLKEIAQNFTPPAEPPERSQSATTGS